MKIQKEPTVRDGAGLSQEERDGLKDRLLADRDGIRQRLATRRGALVGAAERAVDEGDWASESLDQGLVARLLDRDAKLLREVEAALHRMAVGTYGVCTLSGEPIGFERLQARPWTRHALPAKESLERDRATAFDDDASIAETLLPKDDEAA